MKIKFFAILLALTGVSICAQEYSTMMELHEYSVSLGCTTGDADTLLIKSRVGLMPVRTSQQMVYLLRAAESYVIKDYKNSSLFLNKIGGILRMPEYDNVKYFLVVANYCNLKDIENAAKHFYLLNKYAYLDPQNLNSIHKEIRNNFEKEAFDHALSYYYYYHKRQEVLNEIGFNDK